jgi:hypothetical protein
MIKNYTSTVPVERTVLRIEQALARSHVLGINKNYESGKLRAISFRVRTPKGGEITIRLPANEAAVFARMKSAVKRPRQNTFANLEEQAARTAWKLVQEWIEVQLSLIEMQQTDFLQVFLPYVWDGRRTYYEALRDRDFLALPSAKE